MAFSGTVSIWAMKDNDYQATNYPGTTAGLQSAIDSLAGGKGIVQVGPGELLTDTAIWVHSGTHLRGSGRGKTVIKRASGSITDADAANSGAVIASSAYGANGTLSNSGATVSNIEISEITLDGNSSNFGSLTSGTPHQAGILIKSCDGLYIHGVMVRNTLRSGYMLMESQNVTCSDVEADTTGQFSITTTRNAFDFYNFGNATGYGKNFHLSNWRAYNTGDEAVSLTAVSDVVIVNGLVDGCDYTVEVQNDSVPTDMARISVSNVVVNNALSYFMPIFQFSAGGSFKDITISNCSMSGHATLHDTGALQAAWDGTAYVDGWLVENCRFENLNTRDINSRQWVDINKRGANSHSRITIRNCQFIGKPSASATNYGVIAQGAIDGFSAESVLVKDCKTIAFCIFGQASLAVKNVRFSNCMAENVGNHGWFIGASGAAGTIADLRVESCEALDAGLVTAGSCAVILQNNAAGAMSRLYVTGCRGRKVSATNFANGLSMTAGTGTLDSVYISDCDFTDLANPMTLSGATNVRFQPRPGRGTDIASAATISIPTDGDVFHVTGITNITNGITVRGWDNGRTVKLIFDSTPTVSDTGTSVLNGDFVATANDVLTLTCDGTNWYEVARSTN